MGDVIESSGSCVLEHYPSIIFPSSPVTRATAACQASKPLWLDAWRDPVAGLNAFTPCVHCCNLFGDGDWRLIVGDADKKLKVWNGTSKASEHALVEAPVAITSFVSDNSMPKIPSLAVACSSYIFIYRNLRPYYKFMLPVEAVDVREQNIWSSLASDSQNAEQAYDGLSVLQQEDVNLTSRSLEFLSLKDVEARESYVKYQKHRPLKLVTSATCMDVIKLSIDEPDAVSCLVVGTESGRLLILNPAGTAVTKNIWVGTPPAFLAVSGLLEVGYSIYLAGRDGKVYVVKNGTLHANVIQLDTAPVGLVEVNKMLMVACMSEVVHCFRATGEKAYSLYMPTAVVCIQAVPVQNARMTKCVAVALANGEVRLYNQKTLVNTLSLQAPVTAMTFGRYGREENTLIAITKTGCLEIKILPRAANLEAAASSIGPPVEQDIPLQVPKKTRLYVEQTQREREMAAEMHNIFQRDLCKLRLTTARAYVKVLTDGQGAAAVGTHSQLQLNAQVSGLGPLFKVQLSIRNDGSEAQQGLYAVLRCNKMHYKLGKQQMLVPLLVPGLSYDYELDVECLDPHGSSDTIQIVIINRQSAVPALMALLKMPISELDPTE